MSLDLGRGTASRSPREAMLERRIAELSERLRLVPSQFPDSAPMVYLCTIGNGNDILTVGSTHYYGLKYPAADVLEVPTLVPPSTNGGCPDGLTIGTLESETGSLSTVWIGTRLRPGGAGVGPVYSDLTLVSIPRYTQILVRQSIAMPVTGGGTVSVLLPYRVL